MAFENLAPSSMVLEDSYSVLNFWNGAQNAPNNIYVSEKLKENQINSSHYNPM